MVVMALGRDYDNQDCAMARGLELVGERWTLLIVRDAFYGVRRYSDFLAHLEIPRAVLADRLHTLTESGVLSKEASQGSSRAEYVLTTMGLGLWPTLAALSAWATEFLRDGPAHRYYTHAACGAEMVDRASCPACGVRVPVADIVTGPGPAADRTRTDLVSVAMLQPRRLLEPIR